MICGTSRFFYRRLFILLQTDAKIVQFFSHPIDNDKCMAKGECVTHINQIRVIFMTISKDILWSDIFYLLYSYVGHRKQE